MKRTLSTWHVHHAHTAPDLPAAQTVDIGDRSKGPHWRWDLFPAGPAYFSFHLSAVYLAEAGLPAAGTAPSSAADYIERAVVWTRTQRVHDRVDMTALAD